MAPRNRRFLLETIIFSFHVKLREGSSSHHHLGRWASTVDLTLLLWNCRAVGLVAFSRSASISSRRRRCHWWNLRLPGGLDIGSSARVGWMFEWGLLDTWHENMILVILLQYFCLCIYDIYLYIPICSIYVYEYAVYIYIADYIYGMQLELKWLFGGSLLACNVQGFYSFPTNKNNGQQNSIENSLMQWTSCCLERCIDLFQQRTDTQLP